MRKTFLFIFFATITIPAFSPPFLFAGNFVEPTATPPTIIATPTLEPPRYPISTTVTVPEVVFSIPYSLNVTVDFKEVEQKQFIGDNTVAYRQWKNLYIHHLMTQTTQLILDGNDITSFDWAPSRQYFVVIKGGRLLLIDATGNLVEDLSKIIAEPDSGFEVRSCQQYDKFIKADSNQITNAEWSPNENSVRFVYAVNDDGSYCRFYLWQFNVDTYTLTSISSSNDPVWTWLNDKTVVTSGYLGGGGRDFSIVDVPNDRVIFRTEAWGTYPVGSPDGSRLAIATYSLRKLLIFDTATGKQIFEYDFGNENPDEDAIISVINWSPSGRYITLYVEKGMGNISTRNKYSTVIADIETGEFWPLPAHSEYLPVSVIWLPDDDDQALIFDRHDKTTYMSRVLPEIRQIVLVGKITDTLQFPDIWPDNNRYLPMANGKVYDPVNPITNWAGFTAGIWLWDRQKGGPPYPVYLVSPCVQDDDSYYRGDAAVSTPTLSPDETWLVFGQQVGWSVSNNPHYTDITLQAIHLPSGEYHQIAKWSPPESQ